MRIFLLCRQSNYGRPARSLFGVPVEISRLQVGKKYYSCMGCSQPFLLIFTFVYPYLHTGFNIHILKLRTVCWTPKPTTFPGQIIFLLRIYSAYSEKNAFLGVACFRKWVILYVQNIAKEMSLNVIKHYFPPNDMLALNFLFNQTKVANLHNKFSRVNTYCSVFPFCLRA